MLVFSSFRILPRPIPPSPNQRRVRITLPDPMNNLGNFVGVKFLESHHAAFRMGLFSLHENNDLRGLHNVSLPVVKGSYSGKYRPAGYQAFLQKGSYNRCCRLSVRKSRHQEPERRFLHGKRICRALFASQSKKLFSQSTLSQNIRICRTKKAGSFAIR